MIQAAEAAGQQVRRLVGRRDSDPEREVFGHGGHAANQHGGIVDGKLRGVAQGGIAISTEDVVVAEIIGEEDAIKAGLFEHLGDAGPVLEIGIAVALVRLVPP
jgi:hypothetical protein